MSSPILTTARQAGMLLVEMNNRKANAINREFLEAFEPLFEEVEEDETISVVVLSGYDRFFSAGLDIVSLLAYDREEMADFIDLLRKTFLRFFALPAPVLVAINGHAIAGGAILALAGDARVMIEGEGRFGLNEVLLGLPLPLVAIDIFRYAVPNPAVQSYVLFSGAIFSPRQARELKLIDEVIAPDDFRGRVIEIAGTWGDKESAPVRKMKELLRAPTIAEIEQRLEETEDPFLDFWFSESAQEKLHRIRERIEGKGADAD
ncbi:MAG: enoyl-CoA hydratase/isomerase family protein [Deltaproteobacteria bacterium]|nr:MAG: enoyl-CoA hydratase/isomerase family protein [Deltaproteobacteria bacterium]